VFTNGDGIDRNDPRAAAEAAELAAITATQNPTASEEWDLVWRRVIAWCLEGGTLARTGFRLHIVASKLSLDPTAPCLEQIAALAGYGRSAAHNQARQFTEIFNVRGPHDRTEANRAQLSESYRRRHGQGLHQPA
jgi:hypothetical protein